MTSYSPSVMYDDEPSTITEWIRYIIFSFIVAFGFILFAIFIIPFSLFVLYKRYKEKKERERIYGV